MGENQALDKKLKALEGRLNKRVDNKSAMFSGYWSLLYGMVLFIIFSLSFGQKAVEKTIEATLATLEFIISIFT